MSFKALIKDYIRAEGGGPPSGSTKWLEQLIEHRAKEKDEELKKELLNELVLKYSEAEKELFRLNQELLKKQKAIERDLEAAAGIQRTLLPQAPPESDKLTVAWKFIPCEQIGGDIFDIFYLDSHNIAFYMLDVSGHGVPSALVTVSVSQTLRPDGGYVMTKESPGDSGNRIVPPSEVLNALDELYPLERFDMFFTIVYGVFDTHQGVLRYSKAGHPPPVLLNPNGQIRLLECNGPIIGMGGVHFEEEEIAVGEGDKIILYTDGVTEYENPRGGFYGADRFYRLLQETGREPLETIFDKVMESLMEFGQYSKPDDDVSLLGFEIVR